MKVSAMIRLDPDEEPHDRLLSRMADYARRIEASGFPGIWVGDSLGRGRPTLDPLVELATEKISYELESPATGTLLKVVAQETVEVPHLGRE